MGTTYDVLMDKVESGDDFSSEELRWMVEKMKEMDRVLYSVKRNTEERLYKIERKEDGHIPGGL